jgi:hypothetical protein
MLRQSLCLVALRSCCHVRVGEISQSLYLSTISISFTVVLAACSDAGSDATTRGHLELLLDGQRVEYQTVVAEELRSAPGEPAVGAQVTAARSGSDAGGVDLER